MGQFNPLSAVSSLGSLFGAAPAVPTNTGAYTNYPAAGYDPSMISGSGTPYDPTGTVDATAAITGTYGSDPSTTTVGSAGGTQSDTYPTSNTAGKSDASQPGQPAPSGPASVTPASIAAMMAGRPLPAQAVNNPWQPGGGVPSDRVAQGWDAFPGFGGRYGDWSSGTMGPEGGPPTRSYPAGSSYEPQATPPGKMASADQPTGTPSNAAPVPPEPPDDTDQPAPSSQDKAPKPADTAPPSAETPPAPQASQPGPAMGGMPGGAGNLLADLAGLMSGNPMALGRLVQDAMRAFGGGGYGGRQMPGWDQPWMLPNQAGMHTMPGDPSTFGGPQYAGAVPGGEPQASPPPRGAPAAGAPRGAPPAGVPPGRTMPPRQLPPERTGYAQQVPPAAAPRPRAPEEGAWLGRPSPGPPPARFNRAPGQTVGATGARFNADANPQGPMAAPSMRSNGSFPIGEHAAGPIIATTLRRAGLNNNAIQGIMYNVKRESSFNPTSREADQPKFGGEAHYAHGLYQEGGEEWNNYQRWLNGRNWRDPQLQTQFLAENMQKRYPRLWQALQNAQSPEQAASLFAQYYLRPSAPNLVARLNDIRRGDVRRVGVPADQPANSPVQTAGVTQ